MDMGMKRGRRPLFLGLLLIIMIVAFANAASEGFNDPSTNTGVNAWTNPAGAYTSNDVDASGKDGDIHRWQGFGFSIPTGSTVDGIEVRLEWHNKKATEAMTLNVTLLDANGNLVGNSNTTPSRSDTTDVIDILGNSSDPWGATWSTDDINSSNFGVEIEVIKDAGGGGATAFLDNVDIKVTYTDMSDTTPPASVMGLTNQSTGNFWIYWNWTNPGDPDFDEAIIYLNGSNMVNTSNNYYNATGLLPDTVYTITVHTKDINGNINTTDVNSTARTPPSADTSDPVINSASDSPAPVSFGENIMITANVTDDIAISSVWVSIDGVNYSLSSINNSFLTSAIHRNVNRTDVFTKDGVYYNADMNGAGKRFYLNFSNDLVNNSLLKIFARQDRGQSIGIYDISDSAGSNPLGTFAITSATGAWYNITLNISIPTNAIWLGEGTGSGGSPKDDFDYIFAESLDTWELILNTSGLSIGPHNYTVYANDSSGNVASPLSGNFTIISSCSVAIGLSFSSIDWTVSSLPTLNQEARDNNGSGVTGYNVSIVASGCAADLYIKADGDLISGLDSIMLGNESYRFNTSDSTVPGVSFTNLDTDYLGNQIGSNLGDGSNVFLKYFLSVPGAQAAGNYNNTILIKGVKSGSPP